MKKLQLRLGILLLAASFSIGVHADQYSREYSTLGIGNASLFAGGKLLDKDDWSPAENQYDLGAQVAWQPRSWPIGITAAYFSSYGRGDFEGSEFRGYTHELQVGVEKIWAVSSFGRPYVAGGVVFGKAEASLESVADSDHAVGGWVGGGMIFVLAQHLALGIDNRFSLFRVRLFDDHFQGGGFHIGATLGYAW